MNDRKLTRAQKRALKLLAVPGTYVCVPGWERRILILRWDGLNRELEVEISLTTFRAIEPYLFIEDDNGRQGEDRALFYVLKEKTS